MRELDLLLEKFLATGLQSLEDDDLDRVEKLQLQPDQDNLDRLKGDPRWLELLDVLLSDEVPKANLPAPLEPGEAAATSDDHLLPLDDDVGQASGQGLGSQLQLYHGSGVGYPESVALAAVADASHGQPILRAEHRTEGP